MQKKHFIRIAIVVSHPIQYFVPFYRELAKSPKLQIKVFFGSKIGLKNYKDKDLGIDLKWDSDLLSGYEYEFLPGTEDVQNTNFWSINNSYVKHSLKNYKPEVVVMHGYGQGTQLRVLIWCLINKVPTLMISDSSLLRDRPWHIRMIKYFMLRLLFRQISAFLAMGDNNEDYYRYYGVEDNRIFRIHWTLDESIFQKILQHKISYRQFFREQHDIPQDSFVVLFVGKMLAYKRPGDIVLAAQYISTQRVDSSPIYILFAGDGKLRESLEENAHNAGIFYKILGFVNIQEIPHVYAAADVLVHPSEIEAYGLIIVEAAYMGLPLILSNKVGAIGTTDIARPEENTLVYPAGNIPTLAKIILKLSTNHNLCEKMGNASLRISEELSIAKSVTNFINAVQTVVKKDCYL
jgi:glycosyltransferase involved in cell wall biosynthesis